MPRGEAFRDDVHEDSWNVGGAVEGEGWVKPTYLSLSVFPPPRFYLFLLHPWLVGQLVLVSSFVQSSAAWYGGAEVSKRAWLEFVSERILLIPLGRFLVMLGGWLLSLLT